MHGCRFLRSTKGISEMTDEEKRENAVATAAWMREWNRRVRKVCGEGARLRKEWIDAHSGSGFLVVPADGSAGQPEIVSLAPPAPWRVSADRVRFGEKSVRLELNGGAVLGKAERLEELTRLLEKGEAAEEIDKRNCSEPK